MIRTVEEELKNKFKLHRVTGYTGWGNRDSVIINTADTKEEMEEFCIKNEYDLKGNYPAYFIEDPSKEYIEEIKNINTINNFKLFFKPETISIPDDYLEFNINFEPPSFMKVVLNITDTYKFKTLFDENYKFIGKTEIECNLTDNFLFTCFTIWERGIRDFNTGTPDYLGLISEERMNLKIENHYPTVYINGKTHYLTLTKIDKENKTAYLRLEEKEIKY